MPFKDKNKKLEWRRSYYRKRYRESEAVRKDFRLRAKKLRLKLRKWLEEIRASRGCKECGERHPACLEFHHLDPKQDDIYLSDMVSRRLGRKRILLEIDKCVVLCSNCHRKRHWEEEQVSRQRRTLDSKSKRGGAAPP